MHERLKKLRKALDLTQQEFADRIGSKRNTVAKYETEANMPSAAVVSLICREFNVNEDWLRNGNGDMFLPINRENEISKMAKDLLSDETNSFKSRFIAMLAGLSASDWERLENEAKKLLDANTERPASSPEQTPIEEAEAAYIKSRSNHVQKTVQSALNTSADTTNPAGNGSIDRASCSAGASKTNYM